MYNHRRIDVFVITIKSVLYIHPWIAQGILVCFQAVYITMQSYKMLSKGTS